MTLDDWLDRIESLHPKSIELGLDRVAAVAAHLSIRCAPIVFTVAGTNGKGSTCAMLESILLRAGYRVGCYTSPHLLRFNERARVLGMPADDAALVEHLARVEAARVAAGGTALTWFEFTTLAILSLFTHASLDVAVLEVGLGGRLDAVNIVDADCAIITSIDIDHRDWLGETREAIGLEKAHVMRPGRAAVCADPSPPASLVAHAAAIGADLRLFGRDFNYAGDRQQWSWGGRSQRRNSLAYPALRGANQLLNASGVLAALEAVHARLPVFAQAVRQGLAAVELPGRFQIVPGRPAIVLDVAHNPHAAAHLARNLDNMGFYPRTWAVLGMLKDKDIDGVIAALAKTVDHWIVCDLEGPRAASAALLAGRLAARLATTGAQPGPDVVQVATPGAGLRLARERADENDRIVVFGSFLTVADAFRVLKA
ncbi:MAG: bifunctional tetrahydrofolate synthase/dihydrofolate synthase [Lautropia sp.]